MIDPQLSAAAEAINRRSQIGSQLIGGLTNAYSGMAGQESGMVSAAYKPEIGAARGVADWARAGLTSAGQARQADLGAALTQAGVQGPGDINPAQIGTGAGAAAYGVGIADLDNYIAQQAASQARAALGPSFAASMGSYQQGLLGAQLASQLASQQSEIEGRVPGLIEDLRRQDIAEAADRRDYELRRWQAEQGKTESERDYELRKAAQEASVTGDLRDYNLRLREFQAQQAQRRAGITGRAAPTIAGRQAYWQTLADQRTKTDPQGRVWVGTSNGIKPALDPQTKRPLRSADWVDKQAATIMATGYDTATGKLTPQAQKKLQALGYPTAGGISEKAVTTQITTQAKLDQAWKKEVNRHNEAIRRNQIAMKNAQNSEQRATIAQQNADEMKRHNRWTETHPKAAAADKPLGTPTGNRPRRTQSGVWTFADGRPLPANIAVIWEHRYQSGLTDGRGGLGTVNKPTSGGSGQLPRGAQAAAGRAGGS